MVSLDVLKREAVWRHETVPPRLADLADAIRIALSLPNSGVGTIGDYRHLKGYHRSRAWILQSKYCTNRTYSVTETEGNRSGGNDNWIAGLDILAGKALSTLIYDRIKYARQQGRLPHLRQVILENDPWHVHLSIDRAHANDDHTTLLATITGTLGRETPMVTLPVTLPVLREGSSGEHVETAQGLLNARGQQVKIDGDFGPKTEHATRQMQIDHGAESVDGVWGPETWTIAITSSDTR